jgi:hypothetical protein
MISSSAPISNDFFLNAHLQRFILQRASLIISSSTSISNNSLFSAHPHATQNPGRSPRGIRHEGRRYQQDTQAYVQTVTQPMRGLKTVAT